MNDTITLAEVRRMDGESLYAWIRNNLNMKVDWSALLIGETIQRTRFCVERLIGELDAEVELRTSTGEEERVFKVQRKRSYAVGRLRQIDRNLSPGIAGGDAVSAERAISLWKGLGHELMAAIDTHVRDETSLSDFEAEVEKIQVPFGKINAWAWFERRLEKRGLVEKVAA